MASVSIICPDNEWKLIAQNVKQGRIRPTLTNPSKYAYDVIPTGDPAPNPNMVSATRFLPVNETWEFQFRANVDIYIYAYDFDGRVDYDDDAPYTDVTLKDEDGNTLTVDDSTGSLVRISYVHHEIHEGNHYFLSAFDTFDNGDEIVFGVTSPDTDKEAHITTLVQGTSQTEVYIYAGATFTGGVPVTPVNNNGNSENTSDLDIVIAPNVSDLGTLIFAESTGKAGVNPTKSSSGQNERENEIIQKRNTAYIYKAISRDDGNIITYRSSWYEHTPRG